MTQSAALFGTHVMIAGFLAAIAVGVGAWAAIRLLRAHVQVLRSYDPGLEVPISYAGRTYAEGKKIGWKDGIAAFWHIVKYNLFTRGPRTA